MRGDGDEIGRRDALRWLLGLPLHLQLLSSAPGAQPAPPANPKLLIDPTPSAESPIALDLHPRTFVTPPMVAALRAQLARDTAFRSRWQTAIEQFESVSGEWATSTDAYAHAMAAFFACVRRPDNDLGLRWNLSWQTYRDRVMTAMSGWRKDGTGYAPHAVAIALVYDFLYHDLSPSERATMLPWIVDCADKGSWIVAVHHWDNQESDQHIARLLSCLVLPDAASRWAGAYTETTEWAESCNWMGYATGMGYEWKASYPARVGLCAALLALKNAGGLTEAQTTDRMLLHLRDAWQSVRQLVIPHPSSAVEPAKYWFNDRTNMTAPLEIYHRGLNVGAHMLWALALLPGKVKLAEARRYSDQPTLARSEEAYLGYLGSVWDERNPRSPENRLRNVVDYTHVGIGSPGKTRSGVHGFFSFPAWLILNAQERPSLDPVRAGIPLVRRWWPGTLDWTTVLSGFSHTSGSLITYHHRKWWMSGYEEGCRQNGSWHVHRDGPLLIQRGSASHGVVSRKATWAANGTVSFVDHSLYPPFAKTKPDEEDAGSVRMAGGSRKTRRRILADSKLTDFGDVTGWYADAKVVAISSNLVRSYNSTAVQYGRLPVNEPKIAAFTREFVCVRRQGDGTDHEKVFTYDRIRLLDSKFEPRYNLCPATEPSIDGTEVPHVPWAPEDGSWTAVGPTRWDYSGATRLIYDNTREPVAPIPGNGKVCVTWLRPSGVGARVQKLGGLNVRSEAEPKANGAPGINPWNGWVGLDGEWDKVDSPEARAYSGLYSVAIIPAPVSLDTRFLISCEVMAAPDSPSPAQELSCDSNSVGARCGPSGVVFSAEAGGRADGSVSVPSGLSLLILLNLPPSQVRVLTPAPSLTVTSSNRQASESGVLTVTLAGTGVLQFG